MLGVPPVRPTLLIVPPLRSAQYTPDEFAATDTGVPMPEARTDALPPEVRTALIVPGTPLE
jgi:hypothetical protein